MKLKADPLNQSAIVAAVRFDSQLRYTPAFSRPDRSVALSFAYSSGFAEQRSSPSSSSLLMSACASSLAWQDD